MSTADLHPGAQNWNKFPDQQFSGLIGLSIQYFTKTCQPMKSPIANCVKMSTQKAMVNTREELNELVRRRTEIAVIFHIYDSNFYFVPWEELICSYCARYIEHTSLLYIV
jgi:hypothetical protein